MMVIFSSLGRVSGILKDKGFGQDLCMYCLKRLGVLPSGLQSC